MSHEEAIDGGDGAPRGRRSRRRAALYLYGYDLGCTHAAEQVTCNVDPIEAGRLLDGQH